MEANSGADVEIICCSGEEEEAGLEEEEEPAGVLPFGEMVVNCILQVSIELLGLTIFKRGGGEGVLVCARKLITP